MFEQLVVDILNRTLGQYISNLQSQQLSLQIWNGNVTLKDCKIRSDVFHQFQIPLELVDGVVGEIKLSIPWNNLKHKPVIVSISDVRLVCQPTGTVAQKDIDAVKKAILQRKLVDLANLDQAYKNMLSAAGTGGQNEQDQSKGSSFFDSLVSKIIDNLQVSVQRIHLQFTDGVSTAVVAIDEVSAKSTNAQFEEQFISNSADAVYKKVLLQNLAVYFDTLDNSSQSGQHQYILNPVSMSSKLVINKKKMRDLTDPRYHVESVVESISLSLDEHQHESVYFIVDNFNMLVKKRLYFDQHYILLDTSIRSAAARRWSYAIECVLSDVKNVAYKSSWNYIKERRDLRQKYVVLYQKKLGFVELLSEEDGSQSSGAEPTSPAAGGESSRYRRLKKEYDQVLSQLEAIDKMSDLTVEDIRFFRRLAIKYGKNELKKSGKELVDPVHLIEEASGKGGSKQKSGGWLSWIWSSGSGSSSNEELSEEHRQKLYDIIDYNEEQDSLYENSDDDLRLKLQFKITKGDVILLNVIRDKDQIQMPKLIDAQLSSIDAHVELYPRSMNFKLDLSKIEASTEIVESKLQSIIKASERESSNGSLFTIAVQTIPPSKVVAADLDVQMSLLPLEITYIPKFLPQLVHFFDAPKDSENVIGLGVRDSLNAQLDVMGKGALSIAMYGHKSVNLNVDLSAPLIKLPLQQWFRCISKESVNQKFHQFYDKILELPESVDFVFDMGQICVETDIVSKQKKEDLIARISELSEEELERYMYDRFVVHLSNMAIELTELGFQPILPKSNISLNVDLSILPKALNLNKVKVSGDLPSLEVNFTQQYWWLIMALMSGVADDFNQQEKSGDNDAMSDHSRIQEIQTQQTGILDAGQAFTERALLHADGNLTDSDDIASLDMRSVAGSERHTVNLATVAQSKLVKIDCRIHSLQLNVFEHDSGTKQFKKMADLCLTAADFSMLVRPYDLSATLSVAGIVLVSRADGSEDVYHKLIDSQYQDLGQQNGVDVQQQNLANMKFQVVNKKHPQFLKDFKGRDIHLIVDFNAVALEANDTSLVKIYQYVLSTFITPQESPAQQPQSQTKDDQSVVKPSDMPQADNQAMDMQFEFTMRQLSLTLRQKDQKFAFSAVENVGVIVQLPSDGTIRVDVDVGKIVARDLVQRTENQVYFEFVRTLSQKRLLEVQYETFSPQNENYPGYDQRVTVNGGSLQITYLEDFFMQFMGFITKFGQDMALVARNVMQPQSIIDPSQILKLVLDVHLDTPVVLLPKQLSKPDVVIAYLGNMSLNSKLSVVDSNIYCNDYVLNLSKISLKTADQLKVGGKRQELSVLDDLNVDLKFRLPLNDQKHDLPAFTLDLQSTALAIHLTEKQYVFFLDMYQMLMSSPLLGGAGSQSSAQKTFVERKVSDIDLQHPFEQFKGAFNVPQLSLQLKFENSDALATFQVNNIGVNVVTRSNQTMSVLVDVQHFYIQDGRKKSLYYRDIMLPAITDEQQLKLEYSTNPKQDALLIIDANRIQVNVKIGFVFELYQYLMGGLQKSLVMKPHNEVVSDGSQQESPLVVSEKVVSIATLSYRVDAKNTQITLLKDSQQADTNAILLHVDELLVTQESIMSVVLQGISLSLCNMRDQAGTAVVVLDDSEATFVMDNRPSKGKAQSAWALDIPRIIVLRVSYHDLFVFSSIINSVMEKYNQVLQSSSDTVQKGMEVSSQMSQRAESFLSQIQPVQTAENDPNERFKFYLKGFRVILIDDLSNLHLPMFDLQMNEVLGELQNWSANLEAKVKTPLFFNFFNIKNSHWEPVIEPVLINGLVKLQKDCSDIVFKTDKRLDINVSNQLMQQCLFVQSMWDKQKVEGDEVQRQADDPYILRNETGFDIVVWSAVASDAQLINISDQCEVPYRFENWRQMRKELSAKNHDLNIQINGLGWETLKNISIDQSAVQLYPLQPMVKGVSYQLVCEVTLKGNVKHVIFRSGLTILNSTNIDLELMMTAVDGGSDSERVMKLSAGSRCAVPIPSIHDSQIKVRPSNEFSYGWSDVSLDWRKAARGKQQSSAVNIVCKGAKSDDLPDFFMVVSAKTYAQTRQNANVCLMEYTIEAPYELENLLPYSLKYSLYDRGSKQQYNGSIDKGESARVHNITSLHTVGLRLLIPSAGYNESEIAIINNPEEKFEEHHITVRDSLGQALNLKLHYNQLNRRGVGSKKITIFSPYIILNSTGLYLDYKANSLLMQRKVSPCVSQDNVGLQNADSIQPQMFNFASGEHLRGRVEVKTVDSSWSKPFSLETVGAVNEVHLRKIGSVVPLGMKVSTGTGKYQISKVISFAPRFIVRNLMDEMLECKVLNSKDSIMVNSNDKCPVYEFPQDVDKMICFRLPESYDLWSPYVYCNVMGKSFIKVLNHNTKHEILLSVNLILENATIFIAVQKEKESWPYRFDNNSSADVIVYQHKTRPKYRIPHKQSMLYTWDEPAMADRLLLINVNSYEKELVIDEIGTQIPIKYPSAHGFGVLGVDIVFEGKTTVIKLSDWKQPGSIYKMIADGSQKDQQFEEVDVSAPIRMIIELALPGLGISLLDKQQKERVYLSMKDLSLVYKDQSVHESLGFSISWIQADNQDYDADFPIILYPTMIGQEDGKQSALPVLQAAVVRAKNKNYGLDYFKYFSLLLQEISLELNEAFIMSIVDVFKFDAVDLNAASYIYDPIQFYGEPQYQEDGQKMYFEVMEVQPIKANITFERSQGSSLDVELAHSHNPILFLLNIFTMTVGNVSDAGLKLNALILEHPTFTMAQLLELLRKHYTQEVLGQFYKLIGSADFLGNPVGLFNSIGSGVKDVFYEPYLGFVSDRPQDFGIGIAKGASSFIRKTVYGFSDTFAKMSSSVSKGLATATMDSEFQAQRKASRVRNRPRHAIKGATAGAQSFAKSILSGVTGIVEQPMRGAEKEGAGGFVKGFGKGIVGLVAKPAVGLFDFTGNLTEGIRNSANVKNHELERVRYPRYVGISGVLEVYDGRKAYGAFVFHSARFEKFENEVYLAHLDVRKDNIVVMISNYRLLGLQPGGRFTVQWQMMLSDSIEISSAAGGTDVQIKRRETNENLVLHLPDERTCKWLISECKSAQNVYRSQNRI